MHLMPFCYGHGAIVEENCTTLGQQKIAKLKQNKAEYGRRHNASKPIK